MGDHDKSWLCVCLNNGLKKIYETGRFMANPDPGQVVSGKKFVPKNFSRCIDFKYIVFEKPDFGQKTGSGRPGNIRGLGGSS